ncbi:alpha-amylase family glycosyl hydrolase [Clostridium boliviensis]|uniref:Alpha-amylase family glycosyl hydrolase n=1 Tax=Clostridium boliviensis TaxID=318465 RepID=A0ABU4GT45_9CLOT|nr:alpha-amylase family glycosyl hydrolase [Clostridium boliviensis]MDW2800804.1 alpha-amylase family glycosyl hydrolase [Clostridium boliviensis]
MAAYGFRVVLDGVFNHCGRDFFAYQDVLANGRNSEYCSWFSGIDFNLESPLGDPFCYDTWGGYFELPKFNLNNSQVVDYLLKAVLYWIDYFDIDGLRLDAADCLNPDFMKVLRKKTIERKDDFWLMGEVVHGDYREWISEEQLDAVTNYEIFKGLYSSHNDQNLFEIAHSLNREFDSESGIYRNFMLYNFVDNHDQNRLASLVAQTSYLYTIYILLFTIPGIPSIYYGSEWGLKGVKENGSDSAIRPYIDIEQVIPDEPDLEGVIKKLIQIRKKIPALKTGTYKQISIEYQKPFIFQRDLGDDHVLVMINATPNEHIVNLEQYSSTGCLDILNNEQLLNDLIDIKITPYWGRIIYFKS